MNSDESANPEQELTLSAHADRMAFMSPNPIFPRRFETTISELVDQLAKPEETGARGAWDEFYRRYARPLLVYAMLQQKLALQDAEDQVHSFVAYLLEKPRLQRFDHEVGHFRTYLLTLFKRFLKDERAKTTAQKRGGGKVQVGELEEQLTEYRAGGMEAEKAFSREWARGVVQASLAVCEDILAYGNRTDREWFRMRYLEPFRKQGKRPPLEKLMKGFNLTKSQARTVDKRVERSLRSCIEQQVRADTLGPEHRQKEFQTLVREGVNELFQSLGARFHRSM